MHHFLFVTRLTIIALIAIFSTWLSASESTVAMQVATEEFPPFTSETLQGQGIDCTLVREALALEGVEVQFSFMSAARSYEQARIGEVDATVPWAKRPGRDEFFYFSESLRPADSEAWFVSKHNTRFHWNAEQPDFASLKGMTVAIVNGYNYGDDFNAAISQGLLQTEVVRDTELGLKMLSIGRVDLVISPRIVGIYKMTQALTKRDIADIITVPLHAQVSGNDYVLLSKQSPNATQFLDKLNAGLLKLKQTPRYHEILNSAPALAKP